MGPETEGAASFLAGGGESRLIAARHGRRLVIVPHPKPGIRDVIVDPGFPRLVPGVDVYGGNVCRVLFARIRTDFVGTTAKDSTRTHMN